MKEDSKETISDDRFCRCNWCNKIVLKSDSTLYEFEDGTSYYLCQKNCGLAKKDIVIDKNSEIKLSEDKLQHMYDLQKELQDRLLATKYEDYNSLAITNTMFLAMFAELGELLNETSWKPWKEHYDIDKYKIKEELSDVFHFFLAIMIQLNITPDELYKEYVKKNEVNHQRQSEHY
jgi:dimeric dUTPase (all-alpha-NTP-PPase superfamily)